MVWPLDSSLYCLCTVPGDSYPSVLSRTARPTLAPVRTCPRRASTAACDPRLVGLSAPRRPPTGVPRSWVVHFASVSIQNFRAISNVEITGLEDVVVIAGPNGCGKSCVLDAIRLLKSVYGGYQQPNEWQSWFGEFQINVQSAEDLKSLLQDRDRELHIRAEVTLAESERAFLRAHAEDLLRDATWRAMVPEFASWQFFGAASIASQRRQHQPEVDARITGDLPRLLRDLEMASHVGEVIVDPAGRFLTQDSRVLELIFSVYRPHDLGIVDYHGPHRTYTREQLGGINLNVEAAEQQQRQSAPLRPRQQVPESQERDGVCVRSSASCARGRIGSRPRSGGRRSAHNPAGAVSDVLSQQGVPWHLAHAGRPDPLPGQNRAAAPIWRLGPEAAG